MDARQVVDYVGIAPRHWGVAQQYLRCPRCKGRNASALSFKVKPDGHAVWKCWRCEWAGSTHTCPRCERAWQYCSCDGAAAGTQPQHRKAFVPRPPHPGRGAELEQVPWSERHDRFWAECREIRADDPAGRYLLQARSVVLPQAAADVRWHPEVRHWREDWRGPAMIGRITAIATGAPQSLHYTWIAPDGAGKAPIAQPRLLAKGMTKQGGAVRLCDDADLGAWLMVGEGIETCLAGQKQFQMRPAWALIDSGNLAKLPVLEGIETLVLLVDNDRPNQNTGVRAGQHAAHQVEDRWRKAASRRIRWFINPVEGEDVADLVRAARP
jgi:hypothetical protein